LFQFFHTGSELSPLTRENLCHKQLHPLRVPDYPRSRGRTDERYNGIERISGLSPLVRGPEPGGQNLQCVGAIPAPAGANWRTGSLALGGELSPLVRGEYRQNSSTSRIIELSCGRRGFKSKNSCYANLIFLKSSRQYTTSRLSYALKISTKNHLATSEKPVARR
jgi:hypothetical protein